MAGGRRSSYGNNSGGTKSFGPGKIPHIAVEVVSYHTDSVNEDEHYLIAKPISDVYNSVGEKVAEKGKEYKVFTPVEKKKDPSGKLVPVSVRSRRTVAKLESKTAQAFSTGDAMKPGSIVSLDKTWVETPENGEPVIKANYTAGLLHPDAQVMQTKNRPPEEGEEAIEDGAVLTGVVFGSDCAVSITPIKVNKNEEKGTQFLSQNATIINKAEAEPIESNVEAIIEKIDEIINKPDGAIGSRGVFLMGYKHLPEGLSEEEEKEFYASDLNRIGLPIVAYDGTNKETGEFEFASGKRAVETRLLDSDNPFHKDAVEALKSGEWDFSVLPLAQFKLMPSLIPGASKNQKEDSKVFDLSENSAVIVADEDGFNEKGYQKYKNASVAEYGFVDINYAVASLPTHYFRKNGTELKEQDRNISWRDRKELVEENGGYCSVDLNGFGASISHIGIDGSFGKYFNAKPASFASDVVTPLTPQGFVDAIKEYKAGDVGRTITYKAELKANRESEEKKEQDSAPTP